MRLFRGVKGLAGRPETIFTDSPAAYHAGINKVSHNNDLTKRGTRGVMGCDGNVITEGDHNTYTDRYKVMWGFKNMINS